MRYQARLEKETVGKPSVEASVWQPSDPRFVVNVNRIEVGTLVLELWDGRSRDVVWQARTSEKMGRADQVKEQLERAVKRLLEAYPPPRP